MRGAVQVSMVLCCFPRRGKHQGTKTKRSPRGTVHMETGNGNNSGRPSLKQLETLSLRGGEGRHRLPDSFLDSHPYRPPHALTLRLSTFLCKCLYPGRRYFTHHGAFQKETCSSQAADAVRFAEKTTTGNAAKNT